MRRLLTCLIAMLLLGCNDESSTGVPSTQLHVIRQDITAPPLATNQASLWAKVGDGREVRIDYVTSEEFLRFEVPGDALMRKPDGSAFQAGEEILITITIVNPDSFHFQFEPSGLQFNPEHPARLKIRYYHSDHDFNDDGVVNSSDDSIESLLDLWRREGPTASWFRVGSVKFEELDELDANILSFSEYAIAW